MDNLTIVIPVYADWESLKKCISSIIKNVDKRHQIIIVNDCGPEVDLMELSIKKLIKGQKNFIYFRNETNLGFVKTCNRAVLEIDKTNNDVVLLNSDTFIHEDAIEEMQNVLALSDRHGIVSPRSSNATIASIPLKPMNKNGNSPKSVSEEYSKKVFARLRNHLPRFTVVPVAVGFCMLIKRDLIKNFGFLDEVYGLGYGEEVDFCMRVNKFGYSSVLANHAYVSHLESKSFSREKKKYLQNKNHQILLTRFPYFEKVVFDYFNFNINPIDYFGDVIAGKNKKKILVSLYHMPCAVNGTTKNIINFLENLNYMNKKAAPVEVVILAQPDAVKFHNLESFGFRVLFSNEIDELFDVGYSPSQIFHLEHLIILNRYCLKIAISHLDIIALRNYDHYSNNLSLDRIFNDSITYSDRVFTISDYSKNDIKNYFSSSSLIKSKIIHPITEGVSSSLTKKVDIKNIEKSVASFIAENRKFFFVIGNPFPHKALKQTVNSLLGSAVAFIILGYPGDIDEKNVLSLKGGEISDDTLIEIYKKCSGVIFPSTYEGYGLPIAESAYFGKPIILNRNNLSIEVAALTKANAIFFNYFSEIPEIIKNLSNAEDMMSVAIPRNLNNYSIDIIDELLLLVNNKFNKDLLLNRWSYFTSLEKYLQAGVSYRRLLSISNFVHRVSVMTSKNPKIHKIAKRIYSIKRHQ